VEVTAAAAATKQTIDKQVNTGRISDLRLRQLHVNLSDVFDSDVDFPQTGQTIDTVVQRLRHGLRNLQSSTVGDSRYTDTIALSPGT